MERFQKGRGFRVQGSGFRVVVAASLQLHMKCCEGLKLAVFSYRKPKETLIQSQSQILQEFLYIASS